MMDLRFVELAKLANMIVEDCMYTKPGEEILILTDTRITEYMGVSALLMAVMGAVQAAGAEAQMLRITARDRANAELPRIAAEAMLAADGVFESTTMPAGHTFAVKEACARGIRYLKLGSGTSYGHNDAAYRLMPKDREELEAIGRRTTQLADILAKGDSLHFTTALGTDLTMGIGEGKVYNNNGKVKRGSFDVLPPGLAGTLPNHGTSQGRIVVDASIAPIYEPLREPVVLTVVDGYITEVEGGAQAMAWKKMAADLNDPKVYNIGEIGIGAHPRARVTGGPLEDERIYGSVHIGIGTSISFDGKIKAAWHVDANIPKATVEVDGQRILEDGEFLV
jgi:leucyl aminopeptidase (aminopeptidase T)